MSVKLISEARNPANDEINAIIKKVVRLKGNQKPTPEEREALESRGYEVFWNGESWVVRNNRTSISLSGNSGRPKYDWNVTMTGPGSTMRGRYQATDPHGRDDRDYAGFLDKRGSGDRYEDYKDEDEMSPRGRWSWSEPSHDQMFNRTGSGHNRSDYDTRARMKKSGVGNRYDYDDKDEFASARYYLDRTNDPIERMRQLKRDIEKANRDIEYHANELAGERRKKIEKLRAELDKKTAELDEILRGVDWSTTHNKADLERYQKEIAELEARKEQLLKLARGIRGESYGIYCAKRLAEEWKND